MNKEFEHSEACNKNFVYRVPVLTAAKIFGKDANWVRAGLISGYLPIGVATRNGKQITDISELGVAFGRINYYISPIKLKEMTGYEYKG